MHGAKQERYMEKLKQLPVQVLLVGGNLRDSLNHAQAAKTIDEARAAVEQAIREIDAIITAALAAEAEREGA
jgi:hypothetical protein